MFSFWSFFIRKNSFSYLLIGALVIFGFFSILTIPKESNPEVVIPVAIVSTILPGASADDVEKLITNKIEDGLTGNLDDVRLMTSVSRENFSSIVIEFNAKANIDKSIQNTKDEVDKIKPELPAEAEDPVVSDVNFADQPVLILSISSDLAPTKFKELADNVSNELEKVKGVSRVEISGARDREVQIIINKEALSSFGLRLVDVIGAISASNSSLPVGSINLKGIVYDIKFEGDIENTSDIKDLAILNSSGEPVYLRDIAFISDGVEEETTYSRISLGGRPSQQAITFSVFKRSGGDITETTDLVKEKLDELQESGILNNSSVLISFNIGDFVKTDLINLSLTAIQTVALVMIILFIAIGWRESLIAGMSIPFSFLIAFIGLSASGNTLNFVSLFSLILSVGILVDSAIVVTERMHTKIKAGLDQTIAALETIKEFQWPLLSGTMTTIGAFIPLFFISGVTGEFIKSIPATILFVLGASIFVALGVVPLIASLILKRRAPGKLETKQEERTEQIKNWYKAFLWKIVGNRKRENKLLLGTIVSFIIVLSFPIVGLVDVIFFPSEDNDFLFVEIEGREGSTLGQTDLGVRRVEEILYDEEVIESFVTTVGASSSFGDGTTNGGTSAKKLANMTINLKEERRRTSSEVLDDLREKFRGINDLDIKFLQQSGGPPVGAPILINFLGDNIDDLETVASRAEKILNEIPGTTEVDSDSKESGINFVLEVDKAKATELGLNSSLIAQTLRSAIHGTTATTIKKQGDDIDVVVKLDLNPNFLTPHDTSRTNIDAIRQLEIQTPEGSILLGSVLDISVAKSNSAIKHEDGKRVKSVSSELQEGFIAADVLKSFLEREEELEIPSGIIMDLGGENEDVDQSFRDMFVALIVGMLIILSILILQFNSFRQAFFIIVIVPISLIGIFIGLAISGQTLSFPSIMGYIALSGIVVNNSIILIDIMNKMREESTNMTLQEIVIESSAQRLRPIILTTLTTVIGIIPLTYTSAIWSPLAYSIIFGLSFAVFLTLLIVPILYNRWPGTSSSTNPGQDVPHSLIERPKDEIIAL